MPMVTTQEIKSAIKEKKLLIGSNSIYRGIKKGHVERIAYASNCPEEVRKDLGRYAKITKASIEEFKGDAAQLGQLCGKPFRIQMIGIKK